MIPYFFHPEAAIELEQASPYYESRMAGLGKSFATEVERPISFIREFPDAGAMAGPTRRRVLVDRFPYTIVYQHDSDSVVVVAIAHQRRRPRYWQRRK